MSWDRTDPQWGELRWDRSAGGVIIPTAPWTLSDPIVVYGSDCGGGPGVATLQDGNFMLIYTKSVAESLIAPNTDASYLQVFSNTGASVVAETQILTSGAYGFGACTLTNGNVVIAYSDYNDSNKGKFKIVTPAGVEVKAWTDYTATTVYGIDPMVLSLANGNFMILYGLGSNTIYRDVYGPTGSLVTSPTVISTSCYGKSLDGIQLANGNVLCFFIDNSDYEVFYRVFTDAGLHVYASSAISDGYVDQDWTQGVTELQNGNYLFAWYDDENEGRAVRKIYTPAGEVAVASQTYPTAGDHMQGASILSDGTVALNRDNKIEIIAENGDIVETHQLVNAAVNGGYSRRIAFQLTGGEIIGLTPSNFGYSGFTFQILTGS